MAFGEVCPERIDLIHKNYRKLCNLLIDVEEWGQAVIINMLTRYARTQSLSPNQNESLLEESAEKAFYGSEEEEDAKDAKAEAASLAKRKPYVMDPDHRLLLRNTKPLLQSRNAAVSPLPQPCPSPEATGGVQQPGLMMSSLAKEPQLGFWQGDLAPQLSGDREVIHLEGSSGTSPSGIVAKHGKNHFLRTRGPAKVLRRKGGLDVAALQRRIRAAMDQAVEYNAVTCNCIHFALTLLGLGQLAGTMVSPALQ